MERLATVFDVLEADAREDEERKDSSRAIAAARVRGQKFAKYVAAYGEDGLEGISEHLTQIANETAAAYGGDPAAIREAVVAMLKEGMPEQCPKCGGMLYPDDDPQGKYRYCMDCGGVSDKSTIPSGDPLPTDDPRIIDKRGLASVLDRQQNAGDSYQGETVDLGDGKPTDSETGLGGPSPKIDKSDLPESLRQEPIDVGSVRNPAERQSIQHDVADLGDTPGEAIEQARNDAVTKTVNADEPIGPEQTGARTDTWSEAQQQAVASRAAKWSVPLE